MVLAFENPFFSWAGQAERLSNAGATILSAITGKGVTSNTGIAVIDKPLSFLASNPFLTAGIAAVAIAPTAALTAVKAAGTSVKAAFTAASTATKAKVILGGALVAPMMIANPIGATKTVAKAPSAAINIESNLVSFYKNPSLSSAATIFKENPIATSALAVAAIAATGLTVGGGAIIASSLAARSATKENTQALLGQDLALAGIGGSVNPSEISNQAGLPILATQSKDPVPEASLTSTPLKASGKTGISSKKGGKSTKHRQRKGKKGKIYIPDNTHIDYGHTSKCYKFY